MFKIFKAACNHCGHTADTYFRGEVGKCERCGSNDLTKLPTTTGITTQTSPGRYTSTRK